MRGVQPRCLGQALTGQQLRPHHSHLHKGVSRAWGTLSPMGLLPYGCHMGSFRSLAHSSRLWTLGNNLHMLSEREWERLCGQERTNATGDGWGRTDLDGLAALLGISQQLDGERPRVLQCLLEVDEAVAAMPAHRTLPADGHGAGVTVQVQHLGTREAACINEIWDEGCALNLEPHDKKAGVRTACSHHHPKTTDQLPHSTPVSFITIT